MYICIYVHTYLQVRQSPVGSQVLSDFVVVENECCFASFVSIHRAPKLFGDDGCRWSTFNVLEFFRKQPSAGSSHLALEAASVVISHSCMVE
jgi:hypothetical protein